MPVWLDPLFPCPLALFPCRTALPCQTPPSQHCGAEGCSQCLWLWVPAWRSVSAGLCGTAWSLALPQCWQGAAVHISGSVPAVTWQLPGAGAEPLMQSCQNTSVCQAPVWVLCCLLLRCAERSGKVILSPLCSSQRSL